MSDLDEQHMAILRAIYPTGSSARAVGHVVVRNLLCDQASYARRRLKALEKAGLVRSESRVFSGFRMRVWYVTEAGHKVRMGDE